MFQIQQCYKLVTVDKTTDLDGSSICSEGQIPVPKHLRKEETSPGCSISQQSLNSVSPCQPILPSYKQTKMSGKYRSIVSGWLKKREWKDWLEYEESRDAAFCFVCRVYLPNSNAEYDKRLNKLEECNLKKEGVQHAYENSHP